MNLKMTTVLIALCAGTSGALELESLGAKKVAALSGELNVPAVSAPTAADRAPKPITRDIAFKNRSFAELLVNSLKVKPELVVMAGGQSYIYKVRDGLVCYKSFANDIHTPGEPRKAVYSCSILPGGGWKFMGMESYGSGDGRDFSLALYNALAVKAKNEAGLSIKAIELDLPDQAGGTERNLLSCMKPGAEAAAMGFRPVCDFVNGL